jgi:DDE family transposase
MTASLETLVVAAYVFATTFRITRPGPIGKVSDEEIVALAVAQAITGAVSDRRFLGTIDRLLPGFFPDLPDQAQYNRRLLMLAELVAEGRVRLADGTLIACANYPGCASHSQFAGHASFGYCPSKSQFIWGMRLVLLADRKGVPVGYDLVGPKTGQERDAVLELAAAHAGSTLFADGGFWGREYLASMQLIDIELITPTKHKLSQRPAAEVAKARVRLVIESVFATLKRQMGLQDHLAKTLPGLVARIAQRLLALTLGIYLNTLLGRPPRALAAYDGR